MTLRKLPIALVAATLAVAPVVAQAATVERATAPTTQESELSRSVLWIIVAIGVIVGAILLLDDKNDPVSS